MKNKLLLLLLWTVVWTVIFILFPDLFPVHTHLKYSSLLSPFILVTVLFSDPADLLVGEFPEALYPGVVYWIVALILLLAPFGELKKYCLEGGKF